MNADRPDPSRPEDPDHGLDVDAAFADIVARLGPLGAPDDTAAPDARATDDRADDPARDDPARDDPARDASPRDDSAADGDTTAAERGTPDGRGGERAGPPPPDAAGPERLRSLFQPSWQDSVETPASWDDEGHFVPPPPPPLPPVDPRRRVAWAALLGSPVVALLLALLPVGVPGWMGLLLVAAFVGGFGYLVATMRSSPPDDWSDDGARL